MINDKFHLTNKTNFLTTSLAAENYNSLQKDDVYVMKHLLPLLKLQFFFESRKISFQEQKNTCTVYIKYVNI